MNLDRVLQILQQQLVMQRQQQVNQRIQLLVNKQVINVEEIFYRLFMMFNQFQLLVVEARHK